MGENSSKPFFLYYASGDIHVPRYPHSRFRGKSGMGLRGDAILQLDWAVGELTRTLDSLGKLGNTIDAADLIAFRQPNALTSPKSKIPGLLHLALLTMMRMLDIYTATITFDQP